MPSLSSLVPYAIWSGIALLAVFAVVNVVCNILIAHRLHLLSMEVIMNDPETFEELHVIACEACKGKRHVRLHRYGPSESAKTVYLCSYCLPRLERMIRTAYQGYLTTHPQEQPKDAYAQFSARAPQRNAGHGSGSGTPLASRRYQHAAMGPMRPTARC